MAFILTTLIVSVLTFVLAYYGIKLIWKKKETLKRPPCLPTLPIVGSLPYVPSLSKIHAFCHEKAKEMGHVIAFYMCNSEYTRYVIVLNGRKAIQEALVKQSVIFADRPQLYLTALFENNRGIALHPYNDDFKKLHSLSLNILKQFGFGQGIMESRIRIEVEDMLSRFSVKNGQAFDPSYETTASVSNVIGSIIFGKRWNIDDPEFHEGMNIIHLGIRNLEKVEMVNFFPILRFLPAFKKAIKDKMELRKRWHSYINNTLEGIERSDSFYTILKKELEDGLEDKFKKKFAKQLYSVVKDLYLGGTETTATTLRWFIVLMANHQDVQKKIRDEIDQVLGLERHPSLEDKPNLPLLEATLLELMRFKTLVPLALPHSTLKDTYLNGMFIPANTVVLPNLYSCHMDATVWNEPEKFDISRFLDETKTKVMNRDQVVSFSFGKRSCIGEILARQEIFLFASALVHEFEILPPQGQDKIEVNENVAVTNSPSSFEARFVRRLLPVE